MNPRVVAVVPADDYTLLLTFTNGETRSFDMKPYLGRGVFRPLRDPELFATVRPFLGSIAWRDGQDLCPDTLYEGSRPVPASSRAASPRRRRGRGRRRGRPRPAGASGK
jgi:hypothetical protein